MLGVETDRLIPFADLGLDVWEDAETKNLIGVSDVIQETLNKQKEASIFL